MGEFELIRRHFQREGHAARSPVVLGIGDDCALLQPRPGHQLAVSTDMLVESRHFFAGVDPEALGHKALAVNLSDLAAMGARPLGFTLALALPEANEAWLGDYRFYIDDRVIVPRSFIAELLQEQLSPWVEDPWAINNALDLCTGSGCLAILTALAFPEAQVDAVDLSKDAISVAERNIADYHLTERVHPIQSDAFSQLKGKRYDLIISNPPYVDAESVAALPPEYLHEPEMALGSGEDGLDFTHIILREAKKHLTPNGLLIVEIGHNREVLEAAYPTLPFTWLDTTAGDEYVFLLNAADLPA